MILISVERKKKPDTFLEIVFRYICCSKLVVHVYTDASDTGYGGYCVRTGKTISHGLWEEYEIIMSPTRRELAAVKRVNRSFLQFQKTIQKDLQIVSIV